MHNEGTLLVEDSGCLQFKDIDKSLKMMIYLVPDAKGTRGLPLVNIGKSAMQEKSEAV